MADNIAVTPGSGATLASDDIGGIHYPRNKISWGADGSAKDVSAADPFPTADSAVKAAVDALVPLLDGLESLIAQTTSSATFSAVVPNDSTALTGVKALYIGSDGNLVVRGTASVNVLFPVTAGQIVPISPTRVMAATTASGIVALY